MHLNDDLWRMLGILLVAIATAQMFVINIRTWQNRSRAVAPPRLLWAHVMLISLRDLILTTWATWEVVKRLGGPPTWRVVVLITVGIIGNAAFYLVGKVVSSRRHVSERVEEALHDGN